MRAPVAKPAVSPTRSEPIVRSRPEAPVQRRALTAEQGRLADLIDSSPRLVGLAQRQAALFGAPAAQLKAAPAQHLPHAPEEDDTYQLQAKSAAVSQLPPQSAPAPTPAPNRTGLPDHLKSGIEALSGLSMDHVKVHYNSSQPAQLQALAYAQGSHIHLAPGQERHLPHEAWHVVQQAQGRVQPTMQLKSGVPVNDDAGLEREADVMGARALQAIQSRGEGTIQRVLINGHDFTRKSDPNDANQNNFGDALDAILDAQNQDRNNPDSWLAMVNDINTRLSVSGPTPAILNDIRSFYQQAAELNFHVNPVLAESWRRCLAATHDWKTYTKVGGKFKEKFADVLGEINADYPKLASKVHHVVTVKVNKEHMVNKGGAHGGAQTAAINLMHAGIPPAGSSASLSVLHIALHAMKPGTGQIDFNALHPLIRKEIESAQKSHYYDGSAMEIS